jgi:hypothetical protein
MGSPWNARGAAKFFVQRGSDDVTLRRWLWEYRFALLLADLIVFILAAPLADEPNVGRLIIQIQFASLALVSIYVTSGSKFWLSVIIVAVAAWLIIAWTGHGAIRARFGFVGPALLMGVCFIVFAFVERAVFTATVVDGNIVCGGIACYLLVAVIWTFSFAVIESLAPNSFSFPGKSDPAWSDLAYFSLTCLSTLGFGDILPVKPFARIWAASETIVGVIYLAVLVARLVTLYRTDVRK